MIIISILLLAILTRSFVSITCRRSDKSAADLPSASIWDRRHRLGPHSYRVPPSQHDDIFPAFFPFIKCNLRPSDTIRSLVKITVQVSISSVTTSNPFSTSSATLRLTSPSSMPVTVVLKYSPCLLPLSFDRLHLSFISFPNDHECLFVI